MPGYLGIMVTRQQQFCCIFAAKKDKFDYFLNSSTSHTYHHNSILFLNSHKNIPCSIGKIAPNLENCVDPSVVVDSILMQCGLNEGAKN